MSNLEVTMIMQRLEKEDDLYNMEVRNLLSEGGLERLIGQYRTISRRLDKMSAENRELQKNVKDYEDKIAMLEKELEEWKEETRVVKKQRDEQLKSFREGIEPYVDLLHMHETIAELKQRIAELESRETENISEIDTSSPLACAESLIEHMTHCEKFMIMPERDVQTFSVEELKEIADYLMVYYKHHRDRDDEPIAF